MIGKFEELVLLALRRSGNESNAAKVHEAFEQAGLDAPVFAALYTALERMVKKGLVTETEGFSGKRSRRLFSISPEGTKALAHAVSSSDALRPRGLGGILESFRLTVASAR
jgi:DNA-binding PadR family transcriptional regulator